MRPQKASEMYSETTRAIKVTVRPFYLDQHSSPDENRYVWAYHVRIENEGGETVQLRNRHWRITDALGRLHEVRGPGVVGEEPLLQPGQSFEYTSSCPLTTPWGSMVGDYEMETRGGEKFLIRVPSFSLESPQEKRRLN
jgi:ApaG protein